LDESLDWRDLAVLDEEAQYAVAPFGVSGSDAGGDVLSAPANSFPGELEAARQAARRTRLEMNRKMTCSQCEPLNVHSN
jgi:hypothetical protein